MNRALLLAIAAAALPVVGLLGGIVVQEAALRDATEWRIPITGYDPRDPLRGRYILFRYDWAVRGDPALCRRGEGCRLCLEEGGARVAVVPVAASCAAMVDPAASAIRVFVGTPGRVSGATRLWVSEARAPRLEADLQRGPMVAVARLTRGGRLVADRIEPAR